MKKLLVLALGLALMACTNTAPVDGEEVPAVEVEATEEAAEDAGVIVEEAAEEVAEDAATE
jgi:hypothetical protein